MTTTTFTNKQTVIEADWCNDVDALVYQGALTPPLVSADATDSTSGSTGAIHTAGGVGAVKDIISDANIKAKGTTDSTSGTTGALQSAGGIGAVKDIVTDATVKPLGVPGVADKAAVGYSATQGIILQGQGSTNDLVLRNDASAIALRVPTGTTVVDLVSQPSIAVGGGTALATAGGVINVDLTPVGNVGTGTDDLITYTLPASTLNTTGKGVRIKCWGTLANNANGKTVIFNFGAYTFSKLMTASAAGSWELTAEVYRTGADAQYVAGSLFDQGGAQMVASNSATETEAGTIVIKCTGNATTTNDIIQKAMIVEYIG